VAKAGGLLSIVQIQLGFEGAQDNHRTIVLLISTPWGT